MASRRGIGLCNIATGYGDRLSNSSQENVKQMVIHVVGEAADGTGQV